MPPCNKRGAPPVNNEKEQSTDKQNKMKKYILFAAAALVLAACTNENDPMTPADGEVAARIVADIDHVATRASGTSWNPTDRIGVSTVSAGKTSYTNIPYEYDGTNFNATGDKIYFQDPDQVIFRAYYPFTGYSGLSAESIEKTTDAEAQKNLPAIDFLYATGATADKTNPEVNFTGDAAFRHCMSRITIELEEGDDIVFEDKLKAYTLKGLDLQGTFNTETGEAVATEGSAPEAGLNIKLTDAKADGNKKYTAPFVIVFPQEVGGTILLEVDVDGQTYKATLTLPDTDKDDVEDTALKSGYNYKFPVRVTKKALIIGNCEIADWEPAPGAPTDATM